MPKQMHASIAIELPADEFDEAKAKLDFKPLWDAFVASVKNASLAYQVKLDTVDARAPRSPNGTRRPRAKKGVAIEASAPSISPLS